MSLSAPDRDDGGMPSIAVATAEPEPASAVGTSSAIGRRSRNDDAVLCGPNWFAVADGMSGHPDGHIAARVALDALASEPAPASFDTVGVCAAAADRAVRAAARRSGSIGMGATLVAATAVGGGAAVLHLGDSRCYRLADGVLRLLTRDHSYVQELVDLGRIDPDDARRHRWRHVVTRALGVDGAAEPDTSFVPAPVGRLLLCSDGVASALPPRAIGRVLAGFPDPRSAAERLVELADRLGTGDNATAVVVDDLGGRG
jgi:PPM family protein phosphatase